MARQFGDVLRDLGGGATYDELTAKLAELVEAVTETGKVGALSVSLKVKPNGANGVIVQTDIKSKIPEPARGDTVFFVTSGGSLVRQDPRQQDLPLRTVAGATPSERGIG